VTSSCGRYKTNSPHLIWHSLGIFDTRSRDELPNRLVADELTVSAMTARRLNDLGPVSSAGRRYRSCPFRLLGSGILALLRAHVASWGGPGNTPLKSTLVPVVLVDPALRHAEADVTWHMLCNAFNTFGFGGARVTKELSEETLRR
jgi:hypothetical protein